MKILRTPDERFLHLPDYPFAPHYADIDGLRMHYVDEGAPSDPIVLLLHGEPSWSFLYRHMIPLLADAGFRVVAPDLIGFGKSDKLTERSAYTYAAHVDWMQRFIEHLDLQEIRLFCQDWGSLIGLRVAAENSERFAKIALANGGLPSGDQEMPDIFKRWQQFARFSPVFPIGKIIQKGTVAELSDAVIAGYDAPFPKTRFKLAARTFPSLVPTRPDDPASDANRAAIDTFSRWQKPFMTLFSDRDPITRGGEKFWQAHVPGAAGVAHVTIENAGHFLQEEKPHELVTALRPFFAA